MLVDTHCHLTNLSDEEIAKQIERAKARGVERAICIGAGYGVETAIRAVEIAERFPEIWASVAIHPHDAADRTKLHEVEKLATHPRVVAIGETGLDFYRDWSPVEDQYALFRDTIQLAKEVKKPLIIHCREARDEIFSVLQDEHAEAVGGVFHCFSETAEFAEQVFELNFIVSFLGNVTFKKADAIRQVVSALPLERFMLETDAPFMAPEPHRGKPSEPAHVRDIAERIAQLKDIPLETVVSTTTATAERLFGLC